ncbi:unnamed protein product [Allacma fusca]|uniref:Uncharacterized protein n=1 Tax=Allacma fusca TaxID=39272 RepID=A0A8J2L9V6_9HEXA|nr:unnamed protein product [Allacma fusca]
MQKFNSIMNLNLLLFLLVELNMGIGLLRGSYSKNMHMIRAWMVFSTFAAFIFPSCTVTDWIIGDNSEIGAFEIVSSVIGMFAEVLIVWIVGIHKKDIGVLIGRNS